jgi:hypothetical protein
MSINSYNANQKLNTDVISRDHILIIFTIFLLLKINNLKQLENSV